jgi:serine/threonine-protein kinase HipA
MVITPRPRALDIWMNGEYVGLWTATRGGVDVLSYAQGWLDSPLRRPLSLSLPILPGNEPHRGDRVANWFDNLLPDSQPIRDRLRKRFGTSSTQAYDLLAAIGRDCVGAVQIVRAGDDPGDVRRVDTEPLSQAGVAKALRGVTATPLVGDMAGGDDFRISIAGAQEKTALLFHEGQWCRPLGATPTTHILKLPLGLIGDMRANMRDSVENEWACLELLRTLGLPVAEASIATFEDDVSEERALVVKRFDRDWVLASASQPSWLLRLPQEDLCQATGTPGDLKYESQGGPGMDTCLTLLQTGEQPQEDALTFALSQLAFWLLAAIDGHAKNFSVFIRREGHVMTPLYDVLSAWPIIGRNANEIPIQKAALAMAVRGRRPHRQIKRISVRHWRALALRTGVPMAFDRMAAMVEQSEDAVQKVEAHLPANFPTHLWDRLAAGVRFQRQHFLDLVARGA